MTTPDRTCTMCRRVHGVNGWNPRHQSVYAGDSGESLPRKDDTDQPLDASPGVGISAYPFDPVLRQALVDKGILTPQDLRDAQEKIEAITGVVTQRGTHRPAESGAEGAGRSD